MRRIILYVALSQAGVGVRQSNREEFSGGRAGFIEMTYQHDVFISYKREANWTPWTRDHFKNLLQSYLQ
jgi:hypothetical protein